jgi:hypothetical protein
MKYVINNENEKEKVRCEQISMNFYGLAYNRAGLAYFHTLWNGGTKSPKNSHFLWNLNVSCPLHKSPSLSQGSRAHIFATMCLLQNLFNINPPLPHNHVLGLRSDEHQPANCSFTESSVCLDTRHLVRVLHTIFVHLTSYLGNLFNIKLESVIKPVSLQIKSDFYLSSYFATYLRYRYLTIVGRNYSLKHIYILRCVGIYLPFSRATFRNGTFNCGFMSYKVYNSAVPNGIEFARPLSA